MRYMTFGKRSQFSLTETVASVTHIINPINSHNTTANPSQKRGGKGEREKYKKVLNIFLKPPFPFIKQIALIPGIVIKAQRVWIRIQIPLVPGKSTLKSRSLLVFQPSPLWDRDENTSQSWVEPHETAHAGLWQICQACGTYVTGTVGIIPRVLTMHREQQMLGDLRVANRPSTALNTPGLFSKANYHVTQMQVWASLHVMFHLKKLLMGICQRLKRIKSLPPSLSSILEPIR